MMNWGLFALGLSLAMICVWLVLVVRRRWAWPGLVASIGCLLVACLNSAAPFRGLIDPEYVGFRFGLVGADKGISVTLLAGAIMVFGALSAFLATTRRSGRALWIVAATSAAMFVIIGLPTIQGAIDDPAMNSIQFGEYLTVPGEVGSIVLLFVLALPFGVGTVWATGAAWRSTA